MKVLLIPYLGLSYFSLLKDSLEAAGVQIIPGWAFPKRGIFFDKKLDAVHLHMLDSYFFRNSVWHIAMRILYFFILIRPCLRWRKIPLIWTCHEIIPHDDTRHTLLRCLTYRIATTADAIIVHSRKNGQTLSSNYQHIADKITYIAHGDLAPYYEKFCTKHTHNKSTGKHVTFTSVGFMRQDKGTDIIIRAFRKLSNTSARLVLAGACNNQDFYNKLLRLAQGDDRITIENRVLTDKEVTDFHTDSDVMVFAFRSCATSSSIMLAMSLACPIIAPKIGHASELLDESCGILYDHDPDGHALREAMQQAIGYSLNLQALGQSARARARTPAWNEISASTREVYETALE